MKEKTIHVFKNVSHIILIIISVALSVNLFIQFSNYWYIKILLGAMAISLETIKIYILLTAKYKISLKTKFDIFIGSIEFLVFLALAIVSMIASLGFTFVSIEEQSLQFVKTQQSSNFQIDMLIREIESNNRQIEIIQENASGLEFSAVERGAEANRQVLEIQEKNRILIQEVEQFREQRQQEDPRLSSVEMFNLLGDSIGISGRQTMLYMMFALVFLLELALAITSGNIKPDNIFREHRFEVNAYIDALLDVNGKRLNNDETISNKTGIPINNCKRYRELLLKSHYNNIPLIESGRGGTKANFTPSQIKKIIQLQNSSDIHRRKKKS